MRDNLKSLCLFATGVVVGSVVTWKLIEEKYKKFANEEIASVKITFEKLQDELMEDEDEEEWCDEDEDEVEEEEQPVVKYARVINNLRYSDKEVLDHDPNEPYVISPNDFGEIMDYDQVSLTYYDGDGFLADETDELVEDIENTVGFSALDCFGAYVDDAVHVRNDKLQTDYEILRVPDKYRDVIK